MTISNTLPNFMETTPRLADMKSYMKATWFKISTTQLNLFSGMYLLPLSAKCWMSWWCLPCFIFQRLKTLNSTSPCKNEEVNWYSMAAVACHSITSLISHAHNYSSRDISKGYHISHYYSSGLLSYSCKAWHQAY